MPLSHVAWMCLESSPLLRYEMLFSSNPRRKKRMSHESALRQRRQIQFAVLYKQLRQNPSEFFTHLNVSAAIFDYILEQVRTDLARRLPDYMPPEEKLYMVLKYLKGHVPLKTLADNFGLSSIEAKRVLEQTLQDIWRKLNPVHFRTPTHTEIVDLAKEYYKKWKFPNCVGALGGKYIQNKLGIINAVVDANFRFLTVYVDRKRTTIKTFNKNMFDISGMQCLPGSDIMLPLVVIGNPAYPLNTNLMTPYSRRLAASCPDNMKFNKRLKQSRVPVDAAFEILSEKWKVCNSPITMHIDETRLVVKVCCLLYNIVLDREGDKDPHFASFGQIDNGCIYLNLLKGNARQHKKASSTAVSIRDQMRDYIKDLQ